MDAKKKILLVDDDSETVRQVKSHLETLGYDVVTAQDGRAGLQLADSAEPDLAVLDINFPESTNGERTIDGIQMLQQLRDSEQDVRVLMLSGTNVAAVKVMALTMGADDYLAKPFDLEELGARVNAILRRTSEDTPENEVLVFKHLKIDPNERRVWKGDRLVELTKLEFDMLYTLARRPNHAFTREKLLELAWDNVNCSIPKVVDIHIGHIRKKIENDPRAPIFIRTIRGTGYRFHDATE